MVTRFGVEGWEVGGGSGCWICVPFLLSHYQEEVW